MLKLRIKNRDTLIILGISFLNLLIHILTNGQYGFHRDELYFIDCSKHLAFGYIDMPPLTPFFAKLTLILLGDTLQGLRFFPALLSSIIVFMTGLMAKEMGGKLFAQILASITIVVAPIYLVAGTQFQTIPVDQFFWFLPVIYL
jgi:4-amino-4-deoxy-L-arabinose transferase-like glycosyltransferase